MGSIRRSPHFSMNLRILPVRAAREYVRCLEDARDLSRTTGRSELERFLVAVDRLAEIENSCDEAERAVRERMFRGGATDFRQVYVVSELTRQLDRATDSLVHSGLLVRDYVLSVRPEDSRSDRSTSNDPNVTKVLISRYAAILKNRTTARRFCACPSLVELLAT
jgi:hypothetical protein